MILQLPFPPSTNTYWRKGWYWGRRNGQRMKVEAVMVSERGRAYRDEVLVACAQQRARRHHFGGLVQCDLVLLPPTNAKRDLDNYRKALLDALTAAGVWTDDSQVKVDSCVLGPKTPGGLVLVRLAELDVVTIPDWAKERMTHD